MSAGTAHAATQDGQGLTAVAGQQEPIERLVGDVGAVASDLTELARVPTDAATDTAGGANSAASAAEAAASAKEHAKPADGDAVKAGIDRLTTLTASLESISIPVGATGGSHGMTSEHDTESGVDVPVGVQVPGDAASTMPTDAIAAGAEAQDASTQSDGAAAASGTGHQHRHASHVPASAAHAGEMAIGVGDGGDGDLPGSPLDPRAFTSSTTSSSSAGSSAIDGGSGARVMAFHLPYVARSVTVPTAGGVGVPWNTAGKPRVSPD